MAQLQMPDVQLLACNNTEALHAMVRLLNRQACCCHIPAEEELAVQQGASLKYCLAKVVRYRRVSKRGRSRCMNTLKALLGSPLRSQCKCSARSLHTIALCVYGLKF